MKRLAQTIAEWIAHHVTTQVKNLQGQTTEYRTVFIGPPAEILELAFQFLIKDADAIEATLPNGSIINIPVLLQVDKFPTGNTNPVIGKSGICDADYLLDLRNARDCPIFVGLVPPGHHSILTHSSTRSDFGLSQSSNTSESTIYQWLNDNFIQDLVDQALGRHAWPSTEEREDAKKLIGAAVVAADEISRHDVSRRLAWGVLSRLWSISDTQIPFTSLVSLSAGFPPFNDGGIDAETQIGILKDLAERLEDANIRQGIERIKERAANNDEALALDQVLQHLQRKCDVITALGRSISYYYGPFVNDEIQVPPDWWKILTVERWLYLLDGDSNPRKQTLKLECLNPSISQLHGFVPVVESIAELQVVFPQDTKHGTEVLIVREGAKHRREWKQNVTDVVQISDENIPPHKTPVRYTAEVVGGDANNQFKKGSIRIISLSEWGPGVIVCSRTASKGSVPKAPRTDGDKIAFEATLELIGQGRHYLDVHLRPGVVVVGEKAFGSDEQGVVDPEKATPLSKVSETEYGFEVDATGECFYQFEILRAEVGKPEVVRVYLSGDEVAPQECGSEFERLILLNSSRDGGRATTDVHVNRQLRSSDLQGWMLDAANVASSYYPLVFAPDYTESWKSRDWTSALDTVLSGGKFLNDPRPSCEEMSAPAAYISARKIIAERIRGKDGNGVIEAAPLGEWLATDTTFSEAVESYVRAYQEWLSSSPDKAAWCDISIVTRFESDGTTLVQEPDAILISPLHPVRFAWQCLAQKVLFLAQRKLPCPAASILDPDCIPDALVLPLRSASGGIKWHAYFSAECSSDYWGILWNASKLDRLAVATSEPPFDREFGILVGGVSSGFSKSQVHRALDDVSEMLTAKPVINVLVSSAAGQNNACNEGIISWCRERFSTRDGERSVPMSMGPKFLQVLDERKHARPEDVEISNLAEDTDNAVRWYSGVDSTVKPDLGIIAQLETSNAGSEPTKIDSPLGFGGLIRGRIRQQLTAGAGALLSESRMGRALAASGDGLADKTMGAIALLENLSESRLGYVFAPSVHAIESALAKATFAAVSSAAVDPSCFLGGWLKGAYLWDYELPSYSNRAGDSNGYYLLSTIKELDRNILSGVLSRLPACKDLSDEMLDQIVLEVARRGIPTVKGLSGGDSGASGDLGLLIASRLLQDSFRSAPGNPESLFQVWTEQGNTTQIVLVIPIDPFQGYIEDLARAIKKQSLQRPDLIVVAINISETEISCKLTPIEVKYRSADGQMSGAACIEALQQAKSLSALFDELNSRSDEPEMTLWKLAFQHLLVSILGYGFRVYSQQTVVSNQSARWSEHHCGVVAAILSEEIKLDVDKLGRLIVVDGSLKSAPRDCDNDGFIESIVISHSDAASIVKGEAQPVYEVIRKRIGTWEMLPSGSINNRTAATAVAAPAPKPVGEGMIAGLASEFNPATRGQTAAKPESPSSLGPATQELPMPNQLPSQGVSVGISSTPSGIDLLVGETVDGFKQETRRLNLSDTNLNHLNIGVVGDLGTGKTQLLKSLVFQISQSTTANQGIKPKVLIFDYKKDYSSDDFVKAVGARVVKPYHLPLNLFDIAGAGASMTPWLDRFKFFSDVLDKIFSGVGPVQRSLLKRAVRLAYDEAELGHRQPNIYDVHLKYQDILGNKADSVSSIIDDLVDMEMFSPDPSEFMSFDKFLNGVVVISLDALGQDDRTKNMLVAIMLNMFYEHMLQIPKRPYVGTSPKFRTIDSFLLVDEADNIMRYEFDVLRKVLLQGREFGVGVILASQYLRHFKAGATDYRDPLLSWFIHKVPNVTPQELGSLGLLNNVAPLAAERIKSLALHECLFKTHNVSGDIVKGIPFYQMAPKSG